MHRTALITLAMSLGILLAPFNSSIAKTLSDQVSERLRDRIAVSNQSQRIVCEGERLCGSAALPRFYWQGGFRPVWSNEDGPRPQAWSLVRAIRTAYDEGLRPEDYHLSAVEALLLEIHRNTAHKKPPEFERLADLDLILTDTFLLYGSHLSTGRVNPETIRSEWFIKSRDVDLVGVLGPAIEEDRIEKTLEGLCPQHAGYAGLRVALSKYREIEKMGGWSAVPGGPLMRTGGKGKRVAALRSRLIASGDVCEPNEGDPYSFDEALEEAVKKFQRRHGLAVDGIVGPATLAALNVPVEERIRQIKLNMERWRWLPRDFGQRYVLVNIASFELYVMENRQTVMKMPVVVGRRYRRTPVLTGTMTYIALNPYWHIPQKIAKEDILPKIQKDPDYIAKENIRVFRSWEADATEIDPASIDWTQFERDNFPFILRQEPGPSNALGRVKFIFHNKFDIYLHDTPARGLFKESKRSYSSGCIRIEKPIELADYLLSADAKWTRKKIQRAIESGETQLVSIPKPIALHVLYWTAWVDGDGTVHFCNDIYDRDKALDTALNERPPAH